MVQVLSRVNVLNSVIDENTEVPECRGMCGSLVIGQLPEVLPASLMHHQAFQQLQLQLLPFQVSAPST